MKAIVSHDVDHFTATEHLFKDTILPKQFIRSYIELFSGKISLKELLNRYGDLFKNQWQHLNNLVAFNNSYGVPSTFFIAVNQGVGLSYSKKQAAYWIHHLKSLNCRVHIHGIEYTTYEKIEEEYNVFKKISVQNKAGIRMHYIRKNEHTLGNLAKAGYLFDSSEYGFSAPYKISNMWEFPFQIMDGFIIERPKRWQSKNLHQCLEETKKLIGKAHEMNLPYLGIDFHDRYFSNSHKTWKNWYTWLIDYLVNQKIAFTDFESAVLELEKNYQGDSI